MTDSCPETGKTGSYLTWEQANQALKRIKRRRNNKNLPTLTHVHACKTCNKFHLTSQPREQTRAFEARKIRERKRRIR